LGSAFTILNAYLLKPVDLPDARALYGLSWDTDTTRRHRFTLEDYEALQPEARRFAGLAASQNVSVMQDAVSTPGLLVTGNYFELLGARPAVGRLLGPDDAAARGGEAVVVLSHPDPAGVWCPSVRGRGSHRAERNRARPAGATARCRADRSRAGAASGVTTSVKLRS
jgi:hypothetical protein